MPTRTPWDPTTGDVMTAARMDGLPRGWVAEAQVTANQTISTGTETDLTGLTATVDVPAGRKLKISGQGIVTRTVADGVTVGRIKADGATVGTWAQHGPSAATEYGYSSGFTIVNNLAAGSHTFKLTLQRFTGTGSVSLNAGAGSAGILLVEDIGPAS